MNVIAVSRTLHAPAQIASSPWPKYGVFTLCAALYILPFMRVIFAGTDEGSMLCGAERIVHGQVFARDFFEVMGPGTFYWLAAFFKLFGVTFLASRICLFISSLGTGLTLYFLSRRVCSRYQALPCLIMAATYFGAAVWPGISHHVDSNFFALLAVACLVLWQSRQKKILLIAAGFLAAVTTCVLQPKGVLLLGAIWLWLLLLQRRKISAFLTSLGLVTGSYFAVIALVLLYFRSQGALGSLIYANYTFLSHNYSAVNVVGYAQGMFKSYWTPWITATGSNWWSYGIASVLIVPFLLIAALPALMAVIAMRTKWKFVTPAILLYWCCGWTLWASEFHRKDICHLVFGSPLLVVLCVHAVTEIRNRFSSVALQMAAISTVCLAGINCCIVTFAGAHPTAMRVGNVGVLGQATTLRFLNKYVPAGEDTFIYPGCASCYFLTATKNPTRYSFMLYNYNTTAQFREAVGDLDRRRVKFVIWDTSLDSKIDEAFPGTRPKSTKDLIMEPYLQAHYRVVEDDHGLQLMERIGE